MVFIPNSVNSAMSLVQPAVSAMGSVMSDEPPCNQTVKKLLAELGTGISYLAGSLIRGYKIDHYQHKMLHKALAILSSILKLGAEPTISRNCD